MCTVSGEDTDEVIFMTEGENDAVIAPGSAIVCIKCQEDASIILQKRNAYCKPCVIQSINHKFRASLGKSKLVRPGQRALILHSGGKCSTALLHLIRKGLEDTSQKKLRMEASVLYIDDGKERDIKNQVEEYGFDFHTCRLSDAMGETRQKTFDNEFSSYLNSIKTETSKIDITEQMSHHLAVSHAKKLNCSFIFVADHSPKLAIRLLSNACLGRGSQLNHNGFIDSRYGDILFLRPMKDITQEELDLYLSLNAISVIKSVTNINNNSIQSTIRAFVSDLQKNYPATVSTIQKTGEKLGSSAPTESETKYVKCVVCQNVLDTDAYQSSALQATEFSKKISQSGPNGSGCSANASCNQNGQCCSTKDISKEVQLSLCYGCRRSFNDVTKVPPYITDRVARQKQHDEIKNFLL